MRILLALSAFGLALSAPATPAPAQDYLGAHLEAQRYDNLRRHQQSIAKKRNAERAQRGLTSRQRACAKRYRSYDPRTDRYVVRPGVRARCTL